MTKKKKDLNLKDIVLRYSLIALSSLFGLRIFYLIFTPLTIHPVNFITSLFYNTRLSGHIIWINSFVPIEMIDSCIAGAAYFLLFVLAMTFPNMSVKRRILLIVTSFLAFLILNISRIMLLIFMYMNENPSFDFVHKMLWYVMSTLFIVVIWFSQIYIFKIKEIPIYSDIKSLIKIIRK